jgi:hypothetical protein
MFAFDADRERECTECRLARGDHDDSYERVQSRARTLVAALARKRKT